MNSGRRIMSEEVKESAIAAITGMPVHRAMWKVAGRARSRPQRFSARRGLVRRRADPRPLLVAADGDGAVWAVVMGKPPRSGRGGASPGGRSQSRDGV